MKNLIFPLLIVIASSSYGILSTIVKVAMQHGFTSAEAVTAQYMVGFFLALVLFIVTQRSLPRLNKSGVIILTLAGILTAATGTIYGQSLNYLPASLAVVMLFQFTWIGLFIDCALHKRLPSRAETISLIFLIVGTIFAAGVVDVDLSAIAWQGWALGLLSALTFALFIQINSRQVEGITTISRTFFVSLVAVIVISIILTPEILWNGQLFGAGLWKFGLALGLFGIILPILLFSIAVPKVGGSLASILSAMELPVAILASMLVLKEALSTLQFFGIALVLIGMVLPSYISMRRAEKISQG
ncbi:MULTISPECIES: DMT family transporter [Bacillales]|uniref:DMT family transporter n=1 Tax=Lysinibacillus louembei TaxID=1470088 RepID=A0ABZ0S085_9BACI|nr:MULTISPECIES: DMT family transporter [Bacillales]MCT6925777.1 DMT family transporter [Metasolibacillus sp.]MCT6941933.1 DMT family transporter [Metasolibacillus sp.]WPK12886.1 DMT family transporter [Lysinibacillus louembei]